MVHSSVRQFYSQTLHSAACKKSSGNENLDSSASTVVGLGVWEQDYWSVCKQHGTKQKQRRDVHCSPPALCKNPGENTVKSRPWVIDRSPSVEKAMDDHSAGITVVVCEQSISDKRSFPGRSESCGGKKTNLPVGC